MKEVNAPTPDNSDLASAHATVTNLINTFKCSEPDWHAHTPSEEAVQDWFSAWEGWNTHLQVLEHLYAATAPHTPTVVRLTLFSAAATLANEVSGKLSANLTVAGADAITLAHQLVNIPPVI